MLDNFRLLIRLNGIPVTLIPGRDLGFMKAVHEVFPNYAHLLCRWHINKDVETRVNLIMDNPDAGMRFLNRSWYRIINSTSDMDYLAAFECIRYVYRRWPKIIKYVKTTWLVCREKFVRAWTNNALHLGNTCTRRVESAHSPLKSWVFSSTCALDTIFSIAHSKIEN